MSYAADKAVRAAFASQSISCDRLGSPFMARLMALFAERIAPGTGVADRILSWPGDPATSADSVPLRVAGALHGLVIDGLAPDLAAAYPPQGATDDDLWRTVTAAMVAHSSRLLDWIARAPQTNEVRRSVALIPALTLVARATGLPLALREVGCSGGLNLRADLFALQAGDVRYGPPGDMVLRPDWSGPAPDPLSLRVVERRGVDRAPLDPETDRTRLLAYLWPDQPDRRALTEAAIGLAERHPAIIDAADAVAWLARTLPDRPSGAATVLFHTIAWQYLPPEARAQGDALIAAAGAAATADAPLARIAMEADGGDRAGLTLTLWPGGMPVPLARVDFHGRSVTWTGPTAL
ncbi:MAG: DUF2332 family protein [Pseudomonadota bacterium]